MKRRLFAKNLAALLAIPFVAKADQYAPKVGKEVTRSGVKESQEEIVYSEEVQEVKFPGKNTMLLQIKDKCTKIALSEISMENRRNTHEYRTREEPDILHKVHGCIESEVRICGIIIENNIKDYFFRGGVKFTVFLEQGHSLEGVGFITEMSIENVVGSNSIIEFCIDINGQILGTYEGEMLGR